MYTQWTLQQVIDAFTNINIQPWICQLYQYLIDYILQAHNNYSHITLYLCISLSLSSLTQTYLQVYPWVNVWVAATSYQVYYCTHCLSNHWTVPQLQILYKFILN